MTTSSERSAEADFYCREAISGRVDLQKVLETDEVLAFRHTRPKYDVHIVVVPKRHVVSLLDPALDDALVVSMLGAVRSVAASVLAENGACRVLTNMGKYQDTKHLHWHVIAGEPRSP